MTWHFSDGTTVELGGKVEGPSLFAQALRTQLAEGEAYVAVHPMPSPMQLVDVNDAALVHAWLTHEIDLRNRIDNVVIRMRSKPDSIPALPPPPWGDAPAEPGVVY